MAGKTPSLRRCALFAACALTLAGGAGAQNQNGSLLGVIKTRNIEPPPFWGQTITGGPGNSQVTGTPQSDNMSDPSTMDADVFRDGPGAGSDGARDLVDATDGDGLDTIFVGPEDTVVADPGDHIIIYPAGVANPLWAGTYARYVQIKALVRWIRDLLQGLQATSPNAGEPDFWTNAITFASAELSNLSPNFEGGGTISLPNIVALGPYESGDVPASPLDCLEWMAYGEVDPLTATAALDFTAEDFASAVDGAQALLDYLLAQVADE